MPRTKVNRNAKRDREKDDIIKERLREYDALAENELHAAELRFTRLCESNLTNFAMLKQRFSKKMLDTILKDLFTHNGNNTSGSINSNQTNNDALLSMGSVRRNKSKDDGYLTEDSTNTGPIYKTTLIMGRTPGPLSSAKARLRRSRSASGYMTNPNGMKVKQNILTNKAEHSSRPKFRTPQPTPRAQVLSVDRAFIMPKFSTDSPPAIYRWPKKGETIISMSGSPVVAQANPDSVPNVNIPIRNGMLSLRPEKLKQIDGNVINKIDSETLQQIKQLQSNLNSLLRFAEQNLKD